MWCAADGGPGAGDGSVVPLPTESQLPAVVSARGAAKNEKKNQISRVLW